MVGGEGGGGGGGAAPFRADSEGQAISLLELLFSIGGYKKNLKHGKWRACRTCRLQMLDRRHGHVAQLASSAGMEAMSLGGKVHKLIVISV